MEDEHQTTGEALLRMRELTFGFRPPKDACRAYRILMAGLRELEGDIHLHIHKENHILFPSAAAAEASQLAARARPAVTR
jgi:regulator of cell morphogenesis and NO signaling